MMGGEDDGRSWEVELTTEGLRHQKLREYSHTFSITRDGERITSSSLSGHTLTPLLPPSPPPIILHRNQYSHSPYTHTPIPLTTGLVTALLISDTLKLSNLTQVSKLGVS